MVGGGRDGNVGMLTPDSAATAGSDNVAEASTSNCNSDAACRDWAKGTKHATQNAIMAIEMGI